MRTQNSKVIAPARSNRRCFRRAFMPDTKRTKEIYVWTIHDFSRLSEASGKSIQSAIFSAGADNKDKWYLDLFPNGRDKECSDYFSLYLMLQSTKKTEIQLNFQISIIKLSTNEKIGTKGVQRKFVGGMSVGWRNFIRREDILAHTKDFLTNDELKISCEFDYEITTEVKKCDVSIKYNPVIKDLWQFFEQSKFSDCVIVVGDKTFHSHKMMLAARSTVFCKMIEEQMEQKDCVHLQIDDLEPEIVKRMLQFIYTDSVNHIEVMTEELLAAADKFNLTELRGICEVALFEKLAVINAAETLVTAHQFNAKELKTQVIKFINDHLAEVIESSGYKSLEENHTSLLKDLLRAQVPATNVKISLEREVV